MRNKPRLECNRELLAILSDYLEENPDMRFSQALMNCYYIEQEQEYVVSESTGRKIPAGTSWKDEFYLESVELLWRVKEAMGINEGEVIKPKNKFYKKINNKGEPI